MTVTVVMVARVVVAIAIVGIEILAIVTLVMSAIRAHPNRAVRHVLRSLALRTLALRTREPKRVVVAIARVAVDVGAMTIAAGTSVIVWRQTQPMPRKPVAPSPRLRTPQVLLPVQA